MRQLTGLTLASAGRLDVVRAESVVTQPPRSHRPCGAASTAKRKRTAGEKVADTTCIGCHGPKLDGGDSGPKLVGETFLANWSSQSVGELFDWVREAMPAEAPGTLSRDDTAAVIAYILQLNKMPPGKVELSTDRTALDRIRITETAAP